MVQSERHIGEDITVENRFYISSLTDAPELFAKAARQHWGVENGCHWTLDIAFREDDCRKRKGNSAANFSRARRIALNLLKNDDTIKAGVKAKRKVAGWDDEYVGKLIGG